MYYHGGFMLKEKIRKALKEARLKYNLFSTEHPNKSLRGKLFKFLGDRTIQFLKDKTTRKIDEKDLNSGGKRLYFPADMG